MVEFALIFLLFLSIIIGFFNISFTLWVKAMLDFSVRQGVRYAITGSTMSGMGHTASIRERVRQSSGGLIEQATLDQTVTVTFYTPQGVVVNDNAGGNLIEISITDYELPRLSSALLFTFPDPMTVSVSAAGRLEPYPTPPAL